MSLINVNSSSDVLAQFLHQLESIYFGTAPCSFTASSNFSLQELVKSHDPALDRRMRDTMDWSWFSLSRLDELPHSPSALMRTLCACDQVWRLWTHQLLPLLAGFEKEFTASLPREEAVMR